MQKWEYESGEIRQHRPMVIKIKRAHIAADELGRYGWELVSVDNEMAYFKRPLKAKPPTVNMNYNPPEVKSESS